MQTGAAQESAGLAWIDPPGNDLHPGPHGTQRPSTVHHPVLAGRDRVARHNPSVPEPHARQIPGDDELPDALDRHTKQRRCAGEVNEVGSHVQ